ncbi:nucleoside-diphosphate-sugar pyrophosphorylase [Betaproteobacteria bacterium]|nr:nucleoside-diphosphate-sugar pyrophosphorylase [Betaproteobacteria bacterium]
MQAYILCGGLGTRLRSVIKDTQKTIVDIDGRPFLSLVLACLKPAGITRVVLCAGYRADQLETLLPGLSADSGLKLEIVVETSPLGTGGAILNGLQQHPPEGRYLVLNADTFLDSCAYPLIASVSRDTLLAVQVADRSRYGGLRCHEDDRVQELLEKSLTGPGLINGGIYNFSPQTLNAWPVRPCSLERDILPEIIRNGQFFVIKYSGAFTDIGTPESLEIFKREAVQWNHQAQN